MQSTFCYNLELFISDLHTSSQMECVVLLLISIFHYLYWIFCWFFFFLDVFYIYLNICVGMWPHRCVVDHLYSHHSLYLSKKNYKWKRNETKKQKKGRTSKKKNKSPMSKVGHCANVQFKQQSYPLTCCILFLFTVARCLKSS